MKWKTEESKELYKNGIFSLKVERCQLPDGRIMPNYFVMDFPDWVNILPIYPDGKICLLKQYRHASGKIHIEVPGGSTEPHSGEDLEAAATRELLEETGLKAAKTILVGSHYPNPALQTNRVHNFVALDCEKVAEQNLDPFEELELYPCDFPRLLEHIRQGDIDHTIMLASIFQSLEYIKKNHSELIKE